MRPTVGEGVKIAKGNASRLLFVCTVIAATFSLLISHTPAAFGQDNRIVDIVSISWPGSQPASVSVSQVEQNIKNEVGPRWSRYTTLEGGNSDTTVVFQHGLTLESSIYLSQPMPCEGPSVSNFMNAVRSEAYKRLSVERFSNRYLIILAPESGCIWSGRALVGNINNPGGVLVLHNTGSSFVIAHELGHSLGLGHSNFIRCESGAKDGPWGSDCKAVEYGGTVDVMGNVDVDTPLSIYNQWLLGMLKKEDIHQSWLTERIELNAADVVGGKRAIFIRDGKTTYWLEYRRAQANATYKPGLVLYRSDPPPVSAIVSPNPEDSKAEEFSQSVGTDIWMMNWDNYTYVRSRANGSMTLPQGQTATLFSGNISIKAEATNNPNRVIVEITRKPDITPPPKPLLTDSSTWKYPGVSILRGGYHDSETAIASFELDLDGKIVNVAGEGEELFQQTYLHPFTPNKTVYLRNLPEGRFNLAIRAIDVWGNKSAWSDKYSIYVDRGTPTLTSEAKIVSVDSSSTTISWTGANDSGIGLCTTLIHNQDGFVLSRSNSKENPNFTFPTNSSLVAKTQAFDCLGNGMQADFNLSTSYSEAKSSTRTGKWITAPAKYGSGALECLGKCSVSISTSGTINALLAKSNVEIFISGKKISQFTSKMPDIQYSEKINIGPKRKVLRMTGSNFVFAGLISLDLTISNTKPLDRKTEYSDPSLNDPIQQELNKIGFNKDDFTQEWIVLPMARGTTLLDPTLDLCGATYTSENKRTQRRQVTANKLNSPYTFLSTEVVKYSSENDALKAFAELQKAFSDCKFNKGGFESGIFTPYAIQNIDSEISKYSFLKNNLIVVATIGLPGNERQLLGIYQFAGNNFLGTYIVKPGKTPISTLEISNWLSVASKLSKRLN